MQCTSFVIYFCHYTSRITNFDSYGTICSVLGFWTRSKIFEKQPLPSPCLPVCLSVHPHETTRLPLGGFL